MREFLNGRKEKEVFEWIRKRKTVSKQELKELTGLTISTLTRILDDLTSQKLLAEIGFGESTGGRRPILYEINPSYGYVFGMDISRTAAKLVLCNLHLESVDSHTWKMDESMNPERLIAETAAAAKRMTAARRLPMASVLGLGIGAVGPLDRTQGVILRPNYFPAPGWQNVAICRMLHHELGIPVYLENGANTALLGEYWLDAVNQFEHLLYVHAGVGIRSAMMTGGNIVYGAVDMEGSIGQMIIQSDGLAPREESGNYGSWESYASIHALERAAAAALKRGQRSSLEKMVKHADQVVFSMMEQALAQKDPTVTNLFLEAAGYFGIGLANLLNILHPEKVILGGPLISSHPFFFQHATQVAIKKTYHYPDYQVIFGKSRLAEDAVAIGAAVSVMNQWTS